MRPGSPVRAAALALGSFLLLTGCGGSGSERDASAEQQTPATASAGPASPRPATSAPPLPPGSATPPPVLPLPGAVTATPPPGQPGAPAPPAAPAPSLPPARPGQLALPALDTYSYALTGTSTLGTPPKTLKLNVSATPTTPVAQLWSLDARRGDGGGIVDDLTLTRQDDGVYLSAYRLDASTGLAEVALDFAAPTPVLFTPDDGPAGRAWSFDLKSTDGCATAHGAGSVVTPGSATAPRHFKLTLTLRSVGPATCVALTGKRVFDFFHPVGALLPSRLDAVLAGRLAGVPVDSDTRATTAPSAPKAAARRDEPS